MEVTDLPTPQDAAPDQPAAATVPLTPRLEPGVVDIESIDIEARGVARLPSENGTSGGKVVFIEGALPGERVRYKSYRRKPTYEFAEVTEVIRASASRVVPRCAHFGTCGGCSMQHLDPAAQLAIKQRVLEDNFAHIGKLRPGVMLRPIQGPDWGYRFRARLSVRYVPKKGGVLVGFHERKSSYVADMAECHVLPPHIAGLLLPLRELVGSLSIRERLPQIEYAQGADVTVLVLRVLEPLSADDERIVRDFADAHRVQIWLQPKGPDTVRPFHPPAEVAPALSYTLPEYGITMPFRPTDFTQVNHRINRVLVSQALGLLRPEPGERVLDLFCGIGNFTLPLARRSGSVHGIEGSEALVHRAGENARFNGIEHASFAARNLFEVTADEVASWGHFDRWLIDPPREGALAVSQALAALAARGDHALLPKRIVYVSCNPATLARDAAVLVHEGGFRLEAAGVVNMFPHTSHVESMAVFVPPAA
ncbi:23S rRNA (uracil(1939)-C(5))-methyltransferase RlmD [Derxia gummosa]|uniref:23S rRNA (uracil(1939)-C(5))-methyltransferase RlmD n=1 Tax=Derxia gummosa DSM 723 TaxID=1121388 RepID=A0A8B6XAI0_9BURK|nr:23S rRNA (uracil(1939)-C(5))-methyltransferase RlmD [Derxia gummosa]